MNETNSFGVCFSIRPQKGKLKTWAIYARITVNKSRCEIALKQKVNKTDWNERKGIAKNKNAQLAELNTYLDSVRSKFYNHYRQLDQDGVIITASRLKAAYLGVYEKEKQKSLIEVFETHNVQMKDSLDPGTLKNYYSTARYLKRFLQEKFPGGDIFLKELDYKFISSFESYIKENPLRKGIVCNQNGMMKHMERLKRVVRWCVKMGWIEKNPFEFYQLKFKRVERDFLSETELEVVERNTFTSSKLKLVRDLFVFSCYTGLAYCDLMELAPSHIVMGKKNKKWISTTRMKTDIKVNVPILSPALKILNKYEEDPRAQFRGKLFPYVSNQEMNRVLKLMTEVVGLKKSLTFHLARHTFATMLVSNGTPIETIMKLLGQVKITTTMIYTHIVNAKIEHEMGIIEDKLGKSRIA